MGVPKAVDLPQYAASFHLWYLSLQPSWRGDKMPLKRPHNAASLDWKRLQLTGPCGLLFVVIGLGFWAKAMPEDLTPLEVIVEESSDRIHNSSLLTLEASQGILPEISCAFSISPYCE